MFWGRNFTLYWFFLPYKDISYPEGVTFEIKHVEIIKQEKYKTKKLQGAAFIASLHRNAEIETDNKILEGKTTGMKDE